MIKFKINKKGTVTQWFNNPSYIYANSGGVHTGVDWKIRYGAKITIDNPGFVYKTFEPQQLDSNWTGVYVLSKMDKKDMYMEVVVGHFKQNLVGIGDYVEEDQAVGLQGNNGYVFGFYNGIVQQVPVEAQIAGTTTAGSHVHESYRIVKRVKKKESGKHYLKSVRGINYKDADGMYYEIVENDNGTKGYVDPMNYKWTEETARESMIKMLTLQVLWALYNKVISNNKK